VNKQFLLNQLDLPDVCALDFAEHWLQEYVDEHGEPETPEALADLLEQARDAAIAARTDHYRQRLVDFWLQRSVDAFNAQFGHQHAWKVIGLASTYAQSFASQVLASGILDGNIEQLQLQQFGSPLIEQFLVAAKQVLGQEVGRD